MLAGALPADEIFDMDINIYIYNRIYIYISREGLLGSASLLGKAFDQNQTYWLTFW